MPATDLERLVIQLEAQSTKLDKALIAIAGGVDRQLGRIEARTNTMTRRVTNAFNALAPKLTATGAVVFGGAAVYGLQRFIGTVVEAASSLKDTADAIGISTDALQQFGIQAEKAGVGQEEFNSAMAKFSKTIGEAQLKGGPLRKLLMDLGIDINGPISESFLKFSDVIARTGDEQQRTALTTILLGRSSRNLIGFMAQGQDSIRAQGEELKRTGKIMTEEAINKIDELGDKWTEVKRILLATFANVLGDFADDFGKFAEDLKSPEFQASLKGFATTLAEVGRILVNLSPYLPNLIAALTAYRTLAGFGPVVSLGGAAVAGFGVEILKKRQLDREQEIELLDRRLNVAKEEDRILGASLDERIKKTHELIALGNAGLLNERRGTLERLQASAVQRRQDEIRLRQLKEAREADAKVLAAAARDTDIPFAVGAPGSSIIQQRTARAAAQASAALDLAGLLSPDLTKAWQEIVTRAGQAASSADETARVIAQQTRQPGRTRRTGRRT